MTEKCPSALWTTLLETKIIRVELRVFPNLEERELGCRIPGNESPLGTRCPFSRTSSWDLPNCLWYVDYVQGTTYIVMELQRLSLSPRLYLVNGSRQKLRRNKIRIALPTCPHIWPQDYVTLWLMGRIIICFYWKLEFLYWKSEFRFFFICFHLKKNYEIGDFMYISNWKCV